MSTKQVVRIACDAMQFFEIDLPEGVDPETYADSDEAREQFAGLVSSGFIDFQLVRQFDSDGKEV